MRTGRVCIAPHEARPDPGPGREAGRWLFRHENGEASFPSLYTIGRQRRSRRPDDSDEGDVLPATASPMTT
jgi:hypothetical protein